MKTFDKKDIFTLVTVDEAKAYIGKQGYFGDSFKELERDIRSDNRAALAEVFPEGDLNIVFRPLGKETSYGLFLPADKIIEIKEKKYRPFESVDEFMNHLGFQSLMNHYIKVENKITSERYEVMIVGCFNNGIVLPLYGALIMDQLFQEFNICIDGTWQPFGVEE